MIRMAFEAQCVYVLALALWACVHQAGDVIPPGDESACERLAADRGAECATVRAFAKPADNPLGRVELCVPDRYIAEAEAMFGKSWPSDDERFDGLAVLGLDPQCFWCASPGANAYSGCYQPGVPAHAYPATWQSPAVLCVDSRLVATSTGWRCL